MRFIGDVHGNFDAYLAIIEGVDKSIQCGDMGIGFGLDFPKVNLDQMFIRGNHDNPTECAEIANWIKDGTFFEEDSIFCLGGAWSIDWEYRQRYEESTGRKVWWPNEECSIPKLQKIIDYYIECKPEVVVTHDCPTIMAREIHSQHEWDKSKTRQALDAMFEAHKPDVWIHGHHHINKTVDIKGTRFICLAELQFIDMEIS
jgi:Icc-related predicted phosphoesterase